MLGAERRHLGGSQPDSGGWRNPQPVAGFLSPFSYCRTNIRHAAIECDQNPQSVVGQVTADGAYDGDPTYQTIAAHGDDIKVVIPPRATAVPSGDPAAPTQRDRHLAMIAEQGRLAWQATTGYGQRSLVETTMGRYKALIGPRLRARGFAAQQTEAAIGVAVLNRMLVAGRPDSVRRQPIIG